MLLVQLQNGHFFRLTDCSVEGVFQDDYSDVDAWEKRTPELITLLAASATQLRSLDHQYPRRAPKNPAAALPALLGQMSQLTRLYLYTGMAPITTEQVDAVVQTLPSLQHLILLADPHGVLLNGLPLSIATTCRQLQHLQIHSGALGALPEDLGHLRELTHLELHHGRVASLPVSAAGACAGEEF